MALAAKCQFIFNNLEKRTSLNTVIVCPYEMPGCLSKKNRLRHTLSLQNASVVWTMFFCYKMPKTPMKLIMFSYKMPLRFSRWGNMIKMNPFFNEIHKIKLHNFGPGFHVTVSLTKMEASLRGTRPQTL